MSAFSVGAQVATKDNGRAVDNTDNKSVPGTFVKWIPGEAVTLYTALLGLGTAQGALTGRETPDELLARINAGSPGWFGVAAFVAVAFVVFGAISEKDRDQKVKFWSLITRALLALVSLVIWASAMPGAWPYGWHVIRDMGPAYALLLVPLAALFTGVAEWLTKRFTL